MKKLFLLAASLTPMWLSAQSQVCPSPPCAPGTSITTWEGMTPTVKVKCENSSRFNCFSVETAGKLIAPGELKPGNTGVLKVNDAEGKPLGEAPKVKFEGTEKDASGETVYRFSKQQ